MESPFDPFQFDDDNDQGTATSPPAAVLSQSRSRSQTSGTSKTAKSTVSKKAKQQQQRQQLESVKEEGTLKPLPPRLNVRFTLHEEVSSTAVVDLEGEGGSLSQLSVEGTVRAQIQSSNANENPPFCLQISGPMAPLANITCGEHCVLYDHDADNTTLSTPAGGNIGTVRCRVHVPKIEIPICQLFSYSMNVRTQNMPILVQTRASVKDDRSCRVSVQIRSNLSNEGDLSDFTIVVAIPTTLRGETLKVTRGDHGVWDANQRIITWKVGNLPHGESCLVSAEALVSSAVANLIHENPFSLSPVEEKIKCPVLVRCTSEVDQLSDLSLSAVALAGSPATIVQQHTRSYRLLHRVGKT